VQIYITFRNSFKDKFPQLFRLTARLYYFILKLFSGKSQTQVIFNKIYTSNNWGDAESVSGPGSNLKNTEILRNELPIILKELNIKSFLDIPCGDFFWMKEIDLNIDLYIGADVVDDLVTKNKNLFGNEKRNFINLDITKDKLPKTDAIFCRDCLPHFSIKLIKASLRSIKLSGAKYFFTSTYLSCKENNDIHVGGFRPVNFQIKPFSFPKPLKIIRDLCITENQILEDKSIGIWRIEDLPGIK
jgi:hypothetical protein